MQNTSGAKQVDQALRRVNILTLHQSEDPVWFLLKEFRFTSRTGRAFLSAVTSDFDRNVSSLGWSLMGERLSVGSDTLPQDHLICEQAFRTKWEGVCKTLGMRMRYARNDLKGATSLAALSAILPAESLHSTEQASGKCLLYSGES